MKLRDWSLRRWALVIALIILLPLIGLRLHLKWRVHRAVAELRAAGKPVNWEDLNRLYHQPVPDAENAFVALTNAYAKLSRPEDAERELIPVVGYFIHSRSAPLNWPENVRLATEAYLERQQEGLAEALAALELPTYRYSAAYGQKGYDPDQLSRLKFLVSLLHLQAWHSMVTGNWPEACRSTEAQLRIVEYLTDEPQLMTQLIRLAYIAMAMINTELLLGVVDDAGPELTGLQATIRRAGQRWRFDHIVAGERVSYLEAIHWQSERLLLKYDFNFDLDLDDLLNAQTKSTGEIWLEDAQVLLYRMAGFGDRDLLQLLAASRELEAAAGSLEQLVAFSTGWNPPSLGGLIPHYWVELFLLPQGKVVNKWQDGYSRLRAADAALAVAQYRLQHDGKLPASLGELAPHVLEAVPIEPQSGQPFELIVTPDGYGIGRGTPVFNVKLPRP